MRLSPLLLLLVAAVACTDRESPADDDSTGQTADTSGTAPTTDPTSPGTDPTDAMGPTTGALENPSGFCSPAAQDPGACPADYICCSDDPAATQGRLPNYFDGGIDDMYGLPIFSGGNNVLSYSGQCVDIGDFPSPFTSGCPVPCNPTWDLADRDLICGVGAQCCQFRQVDPIKDCVLDPVTSKWRSVHGTDIGKLTTWGPAHTTNQDPAGESCNAFASGGGPVDKEVLVDCYEQLTVADRRGFCFSSCPCQEDLCDQKNPGWVPRCGT